MSRDTHCGCHCSCRYRDEPVSENLGTWNPLEPGEGSGVGTAEEAEGRRRKYAVDSEAEM